MLEVILASNNPSKIYELQVAVKHFGVVLIPQSSLGVTNIEETGLTFTENALLKARHASQQTGLPALADDSGLVVKILNGAPGIYSARYAGPGSCAQDNINKLLRELRDIPISQRQAFFHCTLVYLQNGRDPTPLICQGQWEGHILMAPQGEAGFGYDSIFGLSNTKCSVAELSFENKQAMSHRGQALRTLLSDLPKKLA